MAKNRRHEEGRYIKVPVPAETESGDPLVIGKGLACVALVDRDDDGNATVQTDGVFLLPVKGVKKGGEQEIKEGDIIYMKGAELNVNDEEGIRFGYALAPVVKNKTETIPVKIGY